ncbi:MAG: hypothetical protein ACYTGV_08480 [Planctomycetota bacterium]
MSERARVADGLEPGHSLVPADWVEQILAMEALRQEQWRTVGGRREVNPWDLARAGLLRDLAGLTQKEICLRLQLPRTTLQHRLQVHHESLQHEGEYAHRCASVSRLCLDRLSEV